MSFERKNVIKDQGLMNAFKEGFVEGQAMQDRPIWEVTVEFEGTTLNRTTHDDVVSALQAAGRALDTPGTKVTIEVGLDSGADAPAVTEANDDDVIDAEVLEDE
jgi:hypothetical protein